MYLNLHLTLPASSRNAPTLKTTKSGGTKRKKEKEKENDDDNKIKRELKNAIEKIHKILKNMEDGIDSTNKDDIRDKIGDSTYDLY